MANAIQKRPDEALAKSSEWTPEQRDLIKRTVAPDATDDELAMFLHVCRVSGLDPLRKQAWFVKRKQNSGTRENPKWEWKVTIQAGIDGLQARAALAPDFKGMKHAVVHAKDEVLFDASTGEVVKHAFNPFAPRGEIVGAWATVYRDGKLPFHANVRMEEYFDDRSFLWKGKPSVMLDKVARSTALRMAYPEAFSSLYEPAEMGADSAEETVATPRQEPKPDAPRAALPAREPVVIPEVVDPTPEQKQAARNIVAAAAELQAEIVPSPQDLAARRLALYNRATSPRGANMPKGSVGRWVESVLGRHVASTKDWTPADMDKLEADLERMDSLPDEQPSMQ